ncbi:AMP-binding protein [Piscinibacter sakaiensis]|uniref:Long-chain-fatty-acid--CoA ligase n=1 Tax=Piscinibacter sakaiensis TaxID=1547922 RepID=A0A0K8P7F4_PISS1|nr:AMP-binding protein [Piscinibacter sakaiensis]GAP38125.1 long-chain-fatty-acid--CoA ligase [Piscinibacter sakaiensis]
MRTPAAAPPFWPKALPTEAHVPRTLLWENLEIAARRYPDKVAYRVYGQDTSFGALWRDAQRLAGWLQHRCALAPGDRVLLSGQSSAQFATAFFAILRAGGIAVPVNPMYLADEFAHVAADSGARMAIVAPELWTRIEPLLGRGVDHAVVFGYARDADALDADTPGWFHAAPPALADDRAVTLAAALDAAEVPRLPDRRADDLCLIAYTSGTTARPKGCTQTHLSLMTGAVAPALWRNDTADLVFLGASPMFHMQGLQIVNTTMYLGASMVLLPRWDTRRAAELIATWRVNRFGASPPMLLDLLALPGLAPDALASVGVITGGGSVLAESVSQRLSDELEITYLEGWGMTETCSMAMCNPPRRTKRQCLGIPTFGVRALVVDPDTLEAYPDGPTPSAGELWVSADQVSPHGYWNNDAANREAFVQRDGRRWLRTGDLVTRDADGYHFLVDRLKRMINAGGYKVWPSEVETLLHGHPAVQEACVVATLDPRRGEQVTAVLVLRPGERLDAAAVIDWARGRMAAYKCPRAVEFVERLPRAGTGKIDWRGLQDGLRARDASASARKEAA